MIVGYNSVLNTPYVDLKAQVRIIYSDENDDLIVVRQEQYQGNNKTFQWDLPIPEDLGYRHFMDSTRFPYGDCFDGLRDGLLSNKMFVLYDGEIPDVTSLGVHAWNSNSPDPLYPYPAEYLNDVTVTVTRGGDSPLTLSGITKSLSSLSGDLDKGFLIFPNIQMSDDPATITATGTVDGVVKTLTVEDVLLNNVSGNFVDLDFRESTEEE